MRVNTYALPRPEDACSELQPITIAAPSIAKLIRGPKDTHCETTKLCAYDHASPILFQTSIKCVPSFDTPPTTSVSCHSHPNSELTHSSLRPNHLRQARSSKRRKRQLHVRS
jgi:hypothetical protein